jgi:diadenosine tetraphosphate (Ap4A) HIT family hydrolase
MRIWCIAGAVMVFAGGLVCGGYLFSRSLPRSFLATSDCGDHCYSQKEIAGLVASIAILRAPFMVPDVVMESDTCIAIRYPKPRVRIHYVLFPKHDVKNIANLTSEDVPYVLGCLAMVRKLVSRDKLKAYSLQTNGPARQEITYLHFHLIGE